ncbi:polysaccharide pyruvyl transferase family protein [Chryseobacterium cheonjiense]|uniref:Polysaccharide pyruvyl transferase family protein n=1 Tax=Chryseobacterium cheonjiense TaxID=2728845 RepID=A0A7Y0A5G6_9FLAO|nr:polysaccharide pyruvyl transferase family protein [Chryseobacterium cheonjiense]NML56923.1 polysaccharide pyruvyl transferase family protein [Chryseobacterium cheonjiense]
MINTDILFTGYYGQLNTGDDAFVEVASWGADMIWNKKKSRFLGLQSKLPKTIVNAKGYPLEIPKTYDLQKKILLNNTRFLISAGGSTIHSKMSSNNVKQYAVNLKKTGKKIKIGAIGVSVGPFKTNEDEKAVQQYLKEIDFIAVRDKRSYDYVNSLSGLPYQPVDAFDLAALLPEIYGCQENRSSNNSQKIIGISVCPFESVHKGGHVENEVRRNEQIINLIKFLDKKEDILFKFYIINGNKNSGDKKLTQDVINKAQPKKFVIVDYDKDTQAVWRDINSCDAVIATRLHAGIFACFGNTPFMLVEYHKKCTDFLADIGQTEQARIFDAEFEVQEKAEVILNWLSDRSLYSKPSFLREKIDKAKLNFTAISI